MTRRVPTEAEAKLLLREVARRQEDADAVSAYASPTARARAGRLAWVVALVVGMVGFPFLDRSVPFAVWGVMAFLLSAVASQSVEISRLTKVTTALARMAERAMRDAPLPRAPSPPAGTP